MTDGIELRVREDRYHQAKGRMHAVVDALRATLHRYGMLGHDPPDDTITRRALERHASPIVPMSRELSRGPPECARRRGA